MSHDPVVLQSAPWSGPVPLSLTDAYEVCRQVTQRNSRSFYLTSGLLPPEKRRATRAFYAFCRRSDDLVDLPELAHGFSLDGWTAAARTAGATLADPVLMAWADVRARYTIPDEYIEELFEGVRMDLTVNRYRTFEDLWLYCYRVAATVGLVTMHLVGFASKAAVPYAIKLGVALQLTNILRDVGEDAARGRIYLPLEDMEQYGYTENELLAGVVNDRFRALMDFQIARAERLYDESWPGVGMLARDGRFAIAAAATVYRGILGRIRANDYDVFQQRAYVGIVGKLLMLPRVWWQCREFDRGTS